MGSKRNIKPACDVIGVGMLIPPQKDFDKIWRNLDWALHKEYNKNGDIVAYGEMGFDKDEREKFMRLYGIELTFSRIRNVKLIDVVPDFEKKWAYINDIDPDYGNDGWDIENEKRKKKNSRATQYDEVRISIPANNRLFVV